MYNHGLGDCFLVRFARKDGDGTYNVLIDCGVNALVESAKSIMENVVRDIDATTNGHLDLVIVTHEHWDHVSGFSTQQAQSLFTAMDSIEEVWYAWTEDPSPANVLGHRLRAEREAKVRATRRAAAALPLLGDFAATERASRIGSLLGSFGYDTAEAMAPIDDTNERPIGKTRAAFEYLMKRSGTKVRYRRPSDVPTVLAGTSGVRAYVLGPPENEGLLKRSAPTKKGREVYEFGADLMMDEQLESALMRVAGITVTDDADCPFDSSFRRVAMTGGTGLPELDELKRTTWDAEPWRQIEHDWTAAVEALALNLDSHTNNTCLVIAFELEDEGRVLLFPGDAQIGNWLSWQDCKWSLGETTGSRTVTGPELLARTSLYKVGHHGSHNGTLRDLGLEQMTSDELVAFLPTHKAQAELNRWHEMPFKPLVQRLGERSGGRVVQSDPAVERPDDASLSALGERQRKAFNHSLQPGPGKPPLYWEISLPANPATL
jgi:hypothetical protein